MRTLRAIIKFIAFCLLTAGFYLLLLVVYPLVFAFARAERGWRYFIFRNWAGVMAWLLGMKITVRGAPPRPPFFMVSNHLSYVDVIAFASQLDCVFVAKSDIANWPAFGVMCRSMNTIFIDRTNRQDIPRVNAQIEKVMSNGEGVLAFPEGTSTRGEGVLPFKPGVLEPAARAGCPVHYASISYRTPAGEPPAHLAVSWWGDAAFLPHLFGLFHVSGFEATLVFGAEAIEESDRKLLALRLHDAVQKIFVPVVAAAESVEKGCETKQHQLIS